MNESNEYTYSKTARARIITNTDMNNDIFFTNPQESREEEEETLGSSDQKNFYYTNEEESLDVQQSDSDIRIKEHEEEDHLNMNTPYKSEANTSNFISPYTSHLLKKNDHKFSISNSNSNFFKTNVKISQLDINEILNMSENFSPGPLTKSKIKSLMRDDDTHRNLTPDDGIIGADTLSFVNQSQIQANWVAMGRESTENDYVLRRTHTDYYYENTTDNNATSRYYDNTEEDYQSSFATFINICEQKVKQMHRLDIEKKINFIILRSNFGISRNDTHRKIEIERTNVVGVNDQKLEIKSFHVQIEEVKTNFKENVEKENNLKLKKGERSTQCMSKINMYGFKKPAQIFTSFSKRRGFCARVNKDGVSQVDSNPWGKKQSKVNTRDVSQKDKRNKKFVNFLKEKLSFKNHKFNNERNNTKIKENTENDERRDSLKENYGCFSQNQYNKNFGNMKKAILTPSNSNYQSQILKPNSTRKVNFRSNTKSNLLTSSKKVDISLKNSIKNSYISPKTDLRSSPSLSNLENDNKKYFTENNRSYSKETKKKKISIENFTKFKVICL